METKEALRIILTADEETVNHLPDGLIKRECKKIRGGIDEVQREA